MMSIFTITYIVLGIEVLQLNNKVVKFILMKVMWTLSNNNKKKNASVIKYKYAVKQINYKMYISISFTIDQGILTNGFFCYEL